MANLLSAVRKEVRRHMRDTRPGNFAVGTRQLNRIIEALTHDVDSDLDAGQAWISSVITVDSTTNPPDYALPTSSEYQNILDLRRASDGYILRRLSQEQIAQIRWAGATAAIVTGSKVNAYALRQSTSGLLETITVMFDVRPSASDTIDLLAATSLAAMVDNDDAFIPFQRDFMECFQRGCAARGIWAMSAEEQQARGFTDSPYVAELERAYQQGLKKEKLRLIRMELSQPRTDLVKGEWG